MAGSGETPPKQRAKRGASGLPSGITVRGKKYQARLNHVPTGGTRREQRFVGIFETVDQAVAALADAQCKYADGGAAAVWPEEKEQRAPRGSVRIQPSLACAASAQPCMRTACVLCSGGATGEGAEARAQIRGEDAWSRARKQPGQPCQPEAEGEEGAERERGAAAAATAAVRRDAQFDQ